MRPKPIITLILLAALVAGFAYWRSSKPDSKPQGGPKRAVTVELITARIGDAPVQLSAIGQIVSSHSVAIRPEVSGILLKVLFTEGDAVQKGQLLFEIDAARYRSALKQAEAQVASARASVLATEAQEQRLPPLVDKGYVTPQDLLNAKAAAEQARAAVQVAQAAVVSAKQSINDSRIRSPISGRTGSLAIKAGNLVTANQTTALVTINQLQPVQAEFTIPQAQLAALQAAMAKGPVAIAVSAQTGGAALAQGRLLFVDNSIDAATGTVKLKAEFPNPDESLWPGTFVSFTATLATESNQVLVPELAVQPGAEGSFVYRVNDQGKALLTPVKVARQVGSEVVIAEGLKGGEQLIVRAPRDLKPGMAVQVAGAGAAEPKRRAGDPQPKAATP